MPPTGRRWSSSLMHKSWLMIVRLLAYARFIFTRLLFIMAL
jgi:hypothetical protein